MPFNNGYRGSVNGAVQTSYTDQPGLAVAGMLAFASDLNQADAQYIGETDGIAAGKGVKLSDLTDSISLQRPNQEALLPVVADAAADFAGILVFHENMQSDENGVPGWANGRVGQVLKPGRAGGRIYVRTKEAIDHTTDAVNWVIEGGTDLLYEAGEFAPAALAGNAANGTSVDISAQAIWITSAAAGEVAIIELL